MNSSIAYDMTQQKDTQITVYIVYMIYCKQFSYQITDILLLFYHRIWFSKGDRFMILTKQNDAINDNK